MGARSARFGVVDAVFDSESRDNDSAVPGSQLTDVCTCALCVNDDNGGINDDDFVDNGTDCCDS